LLIHNYSVGTRLGRVVRQAAHGDPMSGSGFGIELNHPAPRVLRVVDGKPDVSVVIEIKRVACRPEIRREIEICELASLGIESDDRARAGEPDVLFLIQQYVVEPGS